MKKISIVFLLFIFIILSGCQDKNADIAIDGNGDPVIEKKDYPKTQIRIDLDPTKISEGKTLIDKPILHFIKVKIGESSLIQIPGDYNILIDCGKDGNDVVKYLNILGIEKIDMLIITQSSPEHYLGLTNIIRKIPVINVYHPKSKIDNSNYDKYLNALDDTDGLIKEIKKNIEININEYTLELIPPKKEYDNIAGNSIVVKFTTPETEVLFGGNINSERIEDLLNENINLTADIYKVSKHGNKSGNPKELLSEISPKIEVIFVDKENQPSEEFLLENSGKFIFRTDKDGDIVLKLDDMFLSKLYKKPLVSETKNRDIPVLKDPNIVKNAENKSPYKEGFESNFVASDIRFLMSDVFKGHIIIVNTDKSPKDIGGYRITSDLLNFNYVFKKGTIIEPYSHIYLYGDKDMLKNIPKDVIKIKLPSPFVLDSIYEYRLFNDKNELIDGIGQNIL